MRKSTTTTRATTSPRHGARLLTLATLLLLTAWAMRAIAVEEIRYYDAASSARAPVLAELLQAAFDRTLEDFGPYKMINLGTPPPQFRVFKQLSNNTGGDIYWTMSSIEREKAAIPVRIPLFRGLYGYRVLIINKKHRKKFAAITSLEQLRELTAGQGLGWPDIAILRSNGIEVTSHARMPQLLTMLKNGRYDFLSMSVIDPIDKVLADHDELMVEPRLLLHYRVPCYFFVNPYREGLARRLHQGLLRTMADGTYTHLLARMLTPAQHRRLAALGGRHKITLENIVLPPETPVSDKSLWFELP